MLSTPIQGICRAHPAKIRPQGGDAEPGVLRTRPAARSISSSNRKRRMLAHLEPTPESWGSASSRTLFLKSTLKISHAIEAVTRAAAHQHLTAPDPVGSGANGVDDHLLATGLLIVSLGGDGKHRSSSCHRARPAHRGGGSTIWPWARASSSRISSRPRRCRPARASAGPGPLPHADLQR